MNNNENKNPYSDPNKTGTSKPIGEQQSYKPVKKKKGANAAGIVFGGLFVGSAGLYLLKFLGILPGFTLLHPSALALIPLVPTLIWIISRGFGGVNTCSLLISLYIFLALQDGMGFLRQLFVPAVMLIIGGVILSRSRLFSNRRVIDSATVSTLKFPVWMVRFGRRTVTHTDPAVLEGAFVSAFCGGIHVDLSKAKLAENTVIDVSASSGSAVIVLPLYSNVTVTGIPVLGIIRKNDTENVKHRDAPNVRIQARAVMGAVEIRKG